MHKKTTNEIIIPGRARIVESREEDDESRKLTITET